MILVRLTPDDYRDLRKTYAQIEYSHSVKGEEILFDHSLYRTITSKAIRTRPQFMEEYNTPGREMYFLKDGDEIKGFVELFFYDSMCEIIEFAVLEKGKGLGSVLFDKTMEIIKEHKIRNVQLWCEFAGAQVFWTKKGFKKFYKQGLTYFKLKIRQ